MTENSTVLFNLFPYKNNFAYSTSFNGDVSFNETENTSFNFITPINDVFANNLTISQEKYLIAPLRTWLSITAEELSNIIPNIPFTFLRGNSSFTENQGIVSTDSKPISYGHFYFENENYIYAMIFRADEYTGPIQFVLIGEPGNLYIDFAADGELIPGETYYYILKGADVSTYSGSSLSNFSFMNFWPYSGNVPFQTSSLTSSSNRIVYPSYPIQYQDSNVTETGETQDGYLPCTMFFMTSETYWVK